MFTDWNADRWAIVGLILCVVAEVLFVLAFSPFPTVDTAAHLASARGFSEVIGGESDTTSRLLEWNVIPPPNLLPQLALGALVPVVGSHWAERLILVGYVLVFSVAAGWAIWQSRPGAMLLGFFMLPLTFHLPFLWGFLNFSYSIAGFLLIAGLLMRWGGGLDSSRMMILASALILVFYTHLVGFLEAGLLTVCILGGACILSEKPWAALMRAAISLAPASILTLVFITTTHSEPVPVSIDLETKITSLTNLLSLTTGISTYDRFERIPCVVTGFALWSLVLIGAMTNRWNWIRHPVPLGLTAFVFLSSVVTLFAPEGIGSGGTLGSIRYALFPILGVILWLAHVPLPSRLLLVGATVASLSAFSLNAVRYDELRATEVALQDLRNLETCLSLGSTVVQGNLRRVGFGSLARPSSLAAETGRLAAARDAIDLGNIDWAVPFGLLQFRKEANPYLHLVPPGKGLFRIESAPPPFDFEAFEHRTGILVDYVLLFGRTLPPGAVEMPYWGKTQDLIALETKRFESQLNDHYIRVKMSPLGIWELWSRRSLASAKRVSGCQT